MKNMKKIMVLALVTGLTATSCKKEFFNINDNPNNPTTVDIKYAFPNGIEYTGYVMGNYFQIWGGLWSQYWTQGASASQYKDWDRYIQSNTEMDRPWSQLYAGALGDFDFVQKTALADGKKNYAACAMIMKAYVFQYLTDVYGDVPFATALMGADNLAPSYEPQKDVYAGIEKLLISALANIDEASDDHPGAEDVLFGGDMHIWRTFANTLRLKTYLRLAYTSEAARCKDSVGAMVARGDAFLDYDARLDYPGVQFQSNPLNTTISALGDYNIVASSTSIDSLISMNDPRMAVWFIKATTGAAAGQYLGLAQGAAYQYPAPTPAHTNYSLPSNAVGGGQNQDAGKVAPVYLFTAAESYFLQAEAYARGWATGSTGETEYNFAVELSFDQWGLTSADATTYLSDPRAAYPAAGTAEQKLGAVITQKWFSFCGSQGLEAWTEFRRTGYPNFLKPSKSSVLTAGAFPGRFVYSADELTRNTNAGKVPNQQVKDKVWWDQN
ncbi:MAG: SusD/RagB family nutrient-binding outer membrane lipoprotein [Bacteroidetes bacterium]|nr:SusD/RagB family nutrient-binding outer membrane lipoprotein [Bacteroidota bacterium]